jgi:rhodanese-related sulfurtransferase
MSASDVPTVNVDELQQMLNGPDPPLLLDVRELDEWQFCRIEGAKYLPMIEIQNRVRELEPARQTVVYCHHGVRSEDVAEFRISRGFKRVASLTEGIDAWSLYIDPTVPRY